MSKVDSIFMGLIYLIFGIPLISLASNAPKVDDVSNIKLDQAGVNTFLNYPSDSVIAADTGTFQSLLCKYFEHPLSDQSPGAQRCGDILKHTHRPDFGENAKKLNSLRSTCLIVGILLCCLAFFKFVSALVPIKKLKRKKLSLKHKK